MPSGIGPYIIRKSIRLDLTHQMGRMTTYRLLEMLTGSEQVYDQEARATARDLERRIPTLLLITRKTVNPDKITPFLGSHHNDVLGDVKLVLHDDHILWVDFGEYESAIWPLTIGKDQYIFFESAFMGKAIGLEMNPDGTPVMSWLGNEGTCEFVAERRIIP